MKPEEIARKYENAHNGYRLIGYAEVGLPVSELNLEAYTIAHKKISIIYEFTLKSISAGLTQIGDLSAFLGFNKKFLEGLLSDLIRSDDISLAGNGNGREQILKLTNKGKESLEVSKRTEIKEQIVPIYFDRIFRKPIFLRNEFLYSSKDLREQGWLEIPAIPAKRIELEDIIIEDVQTFFQQQSRWTNENSRTILSIKNILKRYNKYRYALALRYQAEDSSERISFVVDGILNEQFERTFALKDGIKKLRLERFKVESDEEIDKELQHLIEHTKSNDRILRLKEEESSAVLAVVEAREQLAQTFENKAKDEAEKELEAAEEKHSEKRRALDDLGIRYLTVYEHPPLLEEALTKSTHRLMIISPWIRSKVVNYEFANKLEIILKRNVNVYIGYGIGDGKIDYGAEKKLKNLSIKYPNFTLKEFGNTHAKVLLYDSKFVAISSFNWLSFKGDPTATFRDEQGVLITSPQQVETKFNEQLIKFTE